MNGPAKYSPEWYERDDERVSHGSTRDRHVAGERPDWTHNRTRAVTGSMEAFRSIPGVKREYERGLRNGWIGAGAFYALATVVVILAFRGVGLLP